jgi:hypothetical protein
VPRLSELYPGICLTTEEKARKNLSQGSRRVPAGTMKYLTKWDQWKESQSVTETYVCDRGYMSSQEAVASVQELYPRCEGQLHSPE